jgi:hypothetical protein
MASKEVCSDEGLRGGYVRCTECGEGLRATRAVGFGDLWPMHKFCAQDRQDDEGAGAHAIAGWLTETRTA